MPKSTKVYVVLWDTIGYGYDTVAGVFTDSQKASHAIDTILECYPTGRYVKADFVTIEKELE